MTSKFLSKTNTNKSNILILGDGYMGNHIFNKLFENGYNVTKKSSKELNYHDKKNIYKYIITNDVSTVVNCSGFTGRPNIDEAEIKKELCWTLNVMSPLTVNKICNDLGCRYIHISSGCIYDGYEKYWSEEDPSNYGLFTNHSSFYSKSKHAFELLSEDLYNTILRIRMPFGPDSSHRNYLEKIRKYDKLIDFKNSKTYIPDLCNFVEFIIDKDNTVPFKKEIYNVVNPNPLSTKEVCEIMKEYGFQNDKWDYVTLSELNIMASRSNCILDSKKIQNIYQIRSEKEALHDCFTKLSQKSKENNQEWITNETKY